MCVCVCMCVFMCMRASDCIQTVVCFTCNHQSMHPQYCLDVIFDMIKQLHKYNPSLYTKILLHLLKAADIAYVTVACNILFVEGPVNDYKEEAILIKHVCKNMALIINNLINDPTITVDVKTFSSNMITDTLAFIEYSPAM